MKQFFNDFKKPYYNFEHNNEYHQKMTTIKNKINYFVGDRFMNKYQTWDQIHDVSFKYF